jgi:hypothetical protein
MNHKFVNIDNAIIFLPIVANEGDGVYDMD